MGFGRSTKYSKKRIDDIVNAIMEGCTLQVAAESSGCTSRSLENWRKKYHTVEIRIMDAMARASRQRMRVIHNAGTAEIIERKTVTKTYSDGRTEVTVTELVKQPSAQAAIWHEERINPNYRLPEAPPTEDQDITPMIVHPEKIVDNPDNPTHKVHDCRTHYRPDDPEDTP